MYQKPHKSLIAKWIAFNVRKQPNIRAEYKCFRQGDAYFVSVRPRPRCPLVAAGTIVSAMGEFSPTIACLFCFAYTWRG
jgi:hypothetical protein